MLSFQNQMIHCRKVVIRQRQVASMAHQESSPMSGIRNCCTESGMATLERLTWQH